MGWNGHRIRESIKVEVNSREQKILLRLLPRLKLATFDSGTLPSELSRPLKVTMVTMMTMMADSS